MDGVTKRDIFIWTGHLMLLVYKSKTCFAFLLCDKRLDLHPERSKNWSVGTLNVGGTAQACKAVV